MLIAVLLMALLSPWLMCLAALVLVEKVLAREEEAEHGYPHPRLQCLTCGSHFLTPIRTQTGAESQREAPRRPPMR